jgi:L-threonylcarbamoyladenylate synthase
MGASKEKNVLEISANCIKESGVILCPSDTIYGLSCDAGNEKALRKLKAIKEIEEDRPFIVLVNSDRLFNQCTAEVPEVAWDMIDHTNSPLTLVLPASNYLPEVLRPEQMIAIRYVKEGFIFELINKVNRPIVSTSANISGEPSALGFEEIDEKIKSKLDYIVGVEFANSKEARPSKMVRLKANGEVQILRN